MSDQLLLWLSGGLIVALGATLVVRTVLAERAAGNGGDDVQPFRRPFAVRRLDVLGVILAVLLVAAGITRVVLGTIG